MSLLQKIGTLAFAITVLVGAVLSAWGLYYSLYMALSGLEPTGFSLRRGVPSLALLALSVTYGWLLHRAGFKVASFFAYVISYLGVGAVLSVTVGSMTKGFAPSSPQEAMWHWASAIFAIGLVLLLAALAIRKQAPNHSLQARRP